MLLTITSTTPPATDLGYLLHKNPARLQSFDFPFGVAHVFYPEASAVRCTAALMLEVNPVGLVRGQQAVASQYVNDRPYVASSFMSVAIGQLFRTALNGQCKERPDLPDQPLALTARVAVVQARDGEALLHRLFAPLGYAVSAEAQPLDATFPDWGDSPYFTLTLNGEVRLQQLLAHLYVLLPVLDREKHYWIGESEIEKLMRRGAGWLAQHPERELIAARYLKFKPLINSAIAQLSEGEEVAASEEESATPQEEIALERRLNLHEQRLGTVLGVLKQSGAQRVLDLGCGEGRLLRLLLAEKQFTEIVGMDVSHQTLALAAEKLHLDRMPPMQRQRLTLLHGALTYRDARLAGYDAAAVVEVIEHLDPDRLAAFERVLFEAARPRLVVLTTPNAEYNVLVPTLPAGTFRHRDHRFEWRRDEFLAWATAVAERHGYRVRFLPIGPEDPSHGAPSQMGIFERVADGG